MAKLKNIHPGDILLHEFLEPMGISQNKLARDISVPPRRINEIVLGKRVITADTALRLARYFGSRENSGWDYRVIMIWKKPIKKSGRYLTGFQPLRKC